MNSPIFEASSPTSYTSLTVDRDAESPVATIVLTGPGKGNAMGQAMWREIPDAIQELNQDSSLRAIILTGKGANFTYGLDLTDVDSSISSVLAGQNLGADQRQVLLETIKNMQQAATSIADSPIPVIAAVDGWCIGGGIDIIAACDIRICTERAKFSIREVKVGIVADMGTLARLPHVVGDARTREWALTGRDFDATEAQGAGLVSQVVADDELEEKALEIARAVASNPPLAVRGVKQVLNVNSASQVAQANRFVQVWNAAFMASEDTGEAIRAVMERRQGDYKGR